VAAGRLQEVSSNADPREMIATRKGTEFGLSADSKIKSQKAKKPRSQNLN
jgi:hypothetical protein